MQINSEKLRQLRTERQWSQDQLAKLSGLNLRTIQRLESGAKISSESLSSLAAVFEVPAESLLVQEVRGSNVPIQAIKDGFFRGVDFEGTTSRRDFWWFILAIIFILAVIQLLSKLLDPVIFQIAGLVIIVPLIAACTRRLRDAGLSPWWLLIVFVPVVGVLLLLYLATFPLKPMPKNEGK